MIKHITFLLLLTVTIYAVDYTEYRQNKKTKNHFEEQKYDQAAESLNELINIDPSNSKYYHNLGQAYLNQKKPKEAEKHFLQSLDLNKGENKRNTQLNLAASYLMQQKISKAKKLLKKLIIKNPNDLKAKHNYELATMLEKIQEEQEQQQKNKEENQEDQKQENQEKNKQEQEEQQEQENIEKELEEARQKEEEEKQKRIDQAKDILETLSQREEEARKKHAQKNAKKGTVEYDW